MEYIDGNEVLIGDKVIADNSVGKIVCIISDNQFPLEFPKKFWDYLKTGVLIETEDMGLVHYPIIDQDVRFVERNSE
jgi:ribosome-dependent ATPase